MTSEKKGFYLHCYVQEKGAFTLYANLKYIKNYNSSLKLPKSLKTDTFICSFGT